MQQAYTIQLQKKYISKNKLIQNLLAITNILSLTIVTLIILVKLVKVKKSSIKAALNPYISNLLLMNKRPVNIGASS